jgi:hypothetical protein
VRDREHDVDAGEDLTSAVRVQHERAPRVGSPGRASAGRVASTDGRAALVDGELTGSSVPTTHAPSG